MKTVVNLFLLAALLSGCATVFAPPTPTPTPTPTCAEMSAEYVKNIETILPEWDDAAKLANSTPRMQLAAAIKDLQAITRKVETLEPPDCAQDANSALLIHMYGMTDGFIAFLGQDKDEMKLKFKVADSAMGDFVKAFVVLKQQ